MAAKLECEICGGKLVGKPGGVFECDSCGMVFHRVGKAENSGN